MRAKVRARAGGTAVRNNWIPLAGAGLVVVLAALMLLPFVPGLRHDNGAPYPKAVQAEGVIANDAPAGGVVDVFPEVSGVVASMLVKEGDTVAAGQPLFALDDTTQRATTESLHMQAEAARITLAKMKAPPRKEQVDVALAQVAQARAAVKAAEGQHRRLAKAAALDARAVSREALDIASDAVAQARAALAVSQRELDLLRAGPGAPDIANQKAQTDALDRAWASSKSLLDKYVVRAPIDGVVLTVSAPKGAYLAPLGVFDPATQNSLPAVVLAPKQAGLSVTAYVDQGKVDGLPTRGAFTATMVVRGSGARVPLEFVRAQTTLIPRPILTPQDKDRDPRVLPILFRVPAASKARLYPGQIVDVYIRQD